MAKKKGNNYQRDFAPTDISKVHVPEIGFYGLADQMTEEQRTFCESIIHNNITFCNAKAGTGKTTCAVAVAKFLYEHKLIDNLVYIVSPVEEGTLGYRPGNAEEKIADYMGALHDALVEIGEFPLQAFDEQNGWVQAVSHTFLRGTNLKKACIIIDEAQNYTKAEIKKTITRLHDDCHIVVIGHDQQCDLYKPEQSGFVPMMELFKELGEQKGLKMGFCELTKNFRGIVSQIADELKIN